MEPQDSAFWQEFSAHYMVINTNLYARKVKKITFFFVPIFILLFCQTANKVKTESLVFFLRGYNENEKVHA